MIYAKTIFTFASLKNHGGLKACGLLAISDTFMDVNEGIQIEKICLSEKQEGGRATADDPKMNLDENEKQQNSSGGRKVHERQPAEPHHFKSM